MTTTARPAPGQPGSRTSQVLVAAGLCVVGAVAVLTLVAGVAAGAPAAVGSLSGGSIALCFFVLGSLVVETATRMAPQTSILVALMTYTLQVALVALVFVWLTSSGAVGTTLSAGWVAAGVVVATAAWTLGQLVASARARIPAYDIELPGALRTSPETASHRREVGAP